MLKGVILAGGKGTRLAPLTSVVNKHLLPVYDKPMVFYPLDTLKSFGIEDILIISGGEHIGSFLELLGDGSRYGVNLTYRVQEVASGIAGALALAKDFAAGEQVTVILGDNIFDNKSIPEHSFKSDIAVLFTKVVDHPERFGVVYHTSGLLGTTTIIEKPTTFVGNDAVVGLYIYPNDVFDIIKTLVPSARGELEVTDISNFYLSNGRVEFVEIEGFWSDAGQHDSLLDSSIWAREHGNKKV